jgi:hypothetical protein
MKTQDIVRELVGAYGALVVLGGYFLNSFGYIAATDIRYQAMNLTGGVAFVYYTYTKKAWSSLVVNAAWILIAVVSIWKMSL